MSVNELLAPAGNAECAMAAFAAGADAVYLGLPKFNARERSTNFTAPELGRIISYAHRNGRKVYAALNTVIKENELAEVTEQAALLADLEADAVIVQDLGVLKILRDFFPSLNVHASTQMGFHNSAGLKVAAELGVKRVILERQVTLDELKTMLRTSPVELEIFIHGALCCSLSGQCLFSSYLGGHSGNRGKCKQPCRRRYFNKSGNGFFFSPHDLATPELMGELRRMGIASFKIEGRLRQPDYVFNAVSAYRKLIDAPEINREVLGESRNLLSATYGRRWSEGFFSEKSMSELINFDAIGAAGLFCGRIERLDERGFFFSPVKRLHLGDRLRIQPESGEEGTSFTLTRMLVNGKISKVARPGDKVFISCDKELPPHGMIYKTGESTADFSRQIAALPAVRKKLDLQMTLSASSLDIRVENAPALPDFHADIELGKALKCPVDEAALRDGFAALDSAEFELGRFSADISGSLFFPASEMKSLRRSFWHHVAENLSPEGVVHDSAAGLMKFHTFYASQSAASPDRSRAETVAVRAGGAMPAKQTARLAASVFSCGKNVRAAILPEFCAEPFLPMLRNAIKQAYENGIREFRAGSLFGFELLREYKDILIVACDPLPVANSMAAAELKRLGAGMVQAHVELEKDAVTALAGHSPLPVELYRFGRIPLLVTRASIPVEGNISDNRGNKFLVRRDRFDRLTRVYSDKIFSIPKIDGTTDFYDLRCANWNPEETSEFNFNTPLQ